MLSQLLSLVRGRQRKLSRDATPRREGNRQRRLRIEQLESRQMLSTLPSGFQENLVVGGLYEPSSMTVTPDGRILVTEKPYGVRVVKDGQLLSTPFISLSVERNGERGVEGLVLDPNFSTNRFVYIYYTHLTSTGSFDRLSRFTVNATNPDVADPTSERVLIDGIPTMEPGYHNGGLLRFGADGMLYVGIGDTLNAQLSQDLSKLQGKILRINPAAYPNLVPADNPYVNTAGARGEIWALGFRNPFTGAMKPGTSQLYVNDVGGTLWEEVDLVTKGGNFGWPTAEGMSTNPAFVNPIYTYSHNGGGAAIVGGEFYTGSQFPASYSGKYFFADYVNSFIRTLDVNTGVASNFGTNVFIPVDVDNAPDGSLYWLSLGPGSNPNGAIYKISYVTGNRAPTAIASADKTAGSAPLTVTFNGSQSSDPDGNAISYSWDFGDGTSGSGQIVSHTYNADGTYSAVLTVSDGQATGRSTPISIVVGDEPPQAQIVLPAAGATYRAGDTISFSGTATDPEDGTLPASAYEWKVTFQHNTHFHPFIDSIPDVKSGTFQIPVTGETDPDQWYRIHLTVKDSQGLTTTTFRDVRPVLSTISLATDPPGGSLLLDGQPKSTPASISGVVGMTRTLEAPATQMIGGQSYKFVGWLDGGAAKHTISTPQVATTYTARYQLQSLAASYSSSPPTKVLPGQTLNYPITVTNTGTETWRAAGTNRVRLGVYLDGTSDAAGAWTKEPLRFNLTRDIAPGASFTFQVTFKAPTTPGNYVLRQRMVKELVAWFDTMQKTNVAVQTLAASYGTTVPTIWATTVGRTYSLTVTNTGTATWNATGTNPVRLGVYFGGTSDTIPTGANDPQRVNLPQDVAPGQSVTLTITIKGPTSPGNYVLRHRMIKEGVQWFADISRTNVTVQTVAAAYSGNPPTTWTVGELRTYSIQVTNTGSATWNATGAFPVKLGVYFGSSSDAVGTWAAEPRRFDLPGDVPPGQSVTLTITLRPLDQPGDLILRHRIVKEGVAWTTQMLKTSVTIQSLHAAYSGSVPLVWAPGEEKTYSLSVTNTGTATWNASGTNPVNLGVYFGGSSDGVGDWTSEPIRILWPAGVTSVAPGASVTVTVRIRAPLTPGNYVLRHRMVKENVNWFVDMLRTNVTVG
jgi:glucose/arabinose dehydrogenase